MQPASRFSTVTADIIIPTFTRNVKVGPAPDLIVPTFPAGLVGQFLFAGAKLFSPVPDF
jgi:hypothetical protein